MNSSIVALAAWLVSSAAAAGGPPWICASFEPEGQAMPRVAELFGPASVGGVDRLVHVLRAIEDEGETLVRMVLLQRAARQSEDRDFLLLLLRARAATARPERAVASRFELAFAEECVLALAAERGAPAATQALERAVRGLGADAAAWLGLARATIPRDRCGSMERHAEAFVRAWELAEAMPVGPARDRLRRLIGRDLATVEAQLLDDELRNGGIPPSPVTRLNALRGACGLGDRPEGSADPAGVLATGAAQATSTHSRD